MELICVRNKLLRWDVVPERTVSRKWGNLSARKRHFRRPRTKTSKPILRRPSSGFNIYTQIDKLIQVLGKCYCRVNTFPLGISPIFAAVYRKVLISYSL